MESNITIKRDIYTLKSTGGQLYLGDSKERFCYTLEDVVRGENIKIKEHTAIPSGVYKWHITHSQRFRRDMISVYTDNGFELINKGVSFKGVRLHGGNTHADTEGCPLVAYNRIDADTIQGTAEADLLEWAISVGGNGTITILNT